MIYGLYKRVGMFLKEGVGSARMNIFYWLDEKSVFYYREDNKSWKEVPGSPEEWHHASPPLVSSCPLEFLVLTGHCFEEPR